MDKQAADQNESSKNKSKREQGETGGVAEASPFSSPADFASPEMFGKHLWDSPRPKERCFPAVGDITMSAFLEVIDCRLEDDIILELEEGVDTDILIAYYKDCEKITEFRTEMSALSIDAKTASKLFVAMGKYTKTNKEV
jgi:hypothetical protein